MHDFKIKARSKSNKLDENINRPKHFKNFQGGKMLEKAALDSFAKVSGKGLVTN